MPGFPGHQKVLLLGKSENGSCREGSTLVENEIQNEVPEAHTSASLKLGVRLTINGLSEVN